MTKSHLHMLAAQIAKLKTESAKKHQAHILCVELKKLLSK